MYSTYILQLCTILGNFQEANFGIGRVNWPYTHYTNKLHACNNKGGPQLLHKVLLVLMYYYLARHTGQAYNLTLILFIQ